GIPCLKIGLSCSKSQATSRHNGISSACISFDAIKGNKFTLSPPYTKHKKSDHPPIKSILYPQPSNNFSEHFPHAPVFSHPEFPHPWKKSSDSHLIARSKNPFQRTIRFL